MLSLSLFLCPSLSWATLESSPSILDEGQKHNGNKAAPLLSAVFHTHRLSSPPERFLQIGVWSMLNTNFCLLKGLGIFAMLSFECCTQGTPLNSFIEEFQIPFTSKSINHTPKWMRESGGWCQVSLMCLPVSSRCIELPELLGSGLCGEAMSVLLTQASSKASGRYCVPLNLSICTMHTQ